MKHAHNQHLTNTNKKDITTIKPTYNPVYLHMKYQGGGTIISECQIQPDLGFPRTTQP